MSIPKKIYYCWFGGGKLPPIAKKCIASWKKYCPDFEIVCMNENNCDFECNQYLKEAFEAKKWAFVSDYIRLKTIYENGGVYMDTDVELIKPIDGLLKSGGYMGFDGFGHVSTGLGFSANAGNEIIGEMLKDYENIHFKLPDGSFDTTPCPDRNTKTLERLGMDMSLKSGEFMGMTFLPGDYLDPMDFYSGKIKITENTYSIHRYSASWLSPKAKRTMRIKRIIGVKLYDKLYGNFLYKFDWLEW